MLEYLDKWSDFPDYMEAKTVAAREAVSEHINHTGTVAFLEANPQFYQCVKNAKLIEDKLWIYPCTRRNLELIVRELADELEQAPPAEQTQIDKYASVTLSRQDALAECQPSTDESEQLKKLADDTSLNSHQRKARLKKLALLSGQQRRALAPENLYRG